MASSVDMLPELPSLSKAYPVDSKMETSSSFHHNLSRLSELSINDIRKQSISGKPEESKDDIKADKKDLTMSQKEKEKEQ